MKRFLSILYYIGACALLLGAALRAFLPQHYCYFYAFGAVLFAVTQFILRPRYNKLVLRRLVMQQQLAGLFFLVAAVLMFTHYHNEWLVFLFCGALMELYTSFRISAELKKGDD